MNKVQELIIKASGDQKKNWSSISARVDMDTKLEITKQAARKGKNINQYVLECIIADCENSSSNTIPSHRFEGEYEQLNEEIIDVKNNCHELREENKVFQLNEEKLTARIEQLEKENTKLVIESNEGSLDLLDMKETSLDSCLMEDISHDRKELETIIGEYKKEERSDKKKLLLEQVQKVYSHVSSNMTNFKGAKNGHLIDRYLEEKKNLGTLKRQIAQLNKFLPPPRKAKPTIKKSTTDSKTIILNGEQYEIVKDNGITMRIRLVDDKLKAGIYYPKEGRLNLDGDIGRAGEDVYVTVGTSKAVQN